MRRALWLVVLAACDRFLQLTPVEARDAPPPDGPPPVTCMRDVGVGRNHACAVGPTGDVFCWGQNFDGEVTPSGQSYEPTPQQVLLAGPAVQVGAGFRFSCARLEDGRVECWGLNTSGELGPANTAPDYEGPALVDFGDTALDLEVGAHHACVIRASDRSVMCWGSNKYAALTLPVGTNSSPTPVVVAGTAGTQQLALGHRNGCTLDSNSRVACWGPNFDGSVGQPSSQTPIEMPTAVATQGNIVQIANSGRTSCALTDTGAAQCWGRGRNGELATGGYSSSELPAPTMITGATQIAIGNTGGCALLADRTVECWGDVDPGNGAPGDFPVPVPTSISNVTKLSMHYGVNCALAGGAVECWGVDNRAELGRGSRGVSLVPKTVPVAATPTALAALETGACAIVDGGVVCWGNNDWGQLGDGTTVAHLSPMPVTGVTGAISLAAYYDHACAVLAGNTAVCWGRDEEGELGNGTEVRQLKTPSTYPGTVTQIAVGLEFTCAIDGLGALTCLGANTYGQLGNGSTASPFHSPQSTGLTTVQKVVAGELFACAIRTSGALYCWGRNHLGQLGDTTTTTRNQPVLVMSGTGFIDVAAGRNHACAIDASNNLYCWGDNSSGQLGIGSGDTNVHATPIKITIANETPVQVWAAESDTCARMQSGAVYCWGSNSDGELGNGASFDSETPAAIPELAGARIAAGGPSGGCAVVGTALQCWGTWQMLGDGDNSRSMPAAPLGLPCQ